MVLSTRDDTVAGLDPTFEPHWRDPNTVEWYEGNHVRAFEVLDVLEDSGERFRFKDTRGDTFELLPMTLELYEKHVRLKTIGKVSFTSLDELLAAMRREW